jgi:hypothetical protein
VILVPIESDPLWPQVRPHLDEALGCLPDTDRNAIVLRFLEERSLREVGTALGTSEEAAKKRVQRALDKLRHLLNRRGVKISVVALSAGLAQEGAQAAFAAGLAATISGTVVDGTGQPMPAIQVGALGNGYRGYSQSIDETGKVTSPPEIRVEDYPEYYVTTAASAPGAMTTDRTGRFYFHHFPSDLKALVIEVVGFNGQRRKFRTPGGSKLTIDELPEVSLHDWGLTWTDKTDASGRFCWRAAPVGEVAVWITAGEQRMQKVRLFPSNEEHLISLFSRETDTVRVTGKVMDASTGAPVDRFRVGISHSTSGGILDRPTRSLDGMRGVLDVRTSQSETHVGQHPAWALLIEADGYEPVFGDASKGT